MCCVTATATVLGSKVSAQQRFEPPVDLTDEFVQEALAAAESTRVRDEEFLRQVEARDRAASLIAKAETRLEARPDAQLSTAIAELGLALASGASAGIRTQSDKLEMMLGGNQDPFAMFADVFGVQKRLAALLQRSVDLEPLPNGRMRRCERRSRLRMLVMHSERFSAVARSLSTRSLCFVLMPFAEKLQPIYDDHIRPTIERANLRCERADEIHGPTLITWDIWERVNRARFLIADLTDQNPNVFTSSGSRMRLARMLSF